MKLNRYLWVWTTSDVLRNTGTFINNLTGLEINHIFLYVRELEYTTLENELSTFISSMSRHNIKVWGLNGDRSFLSDGVGPIPIYNSVNNLIAYNKRQTSVNNKFYGFQTDIEPADTVDFKSFHSGVADSKLNTNSGGIWQSTEKADRYKLMESWLSIHDTIKKKLKSHSVQFGAALPWWIDDYNGEPLSTIYKGKLDTVFHHFSLILDEMHFMTYNTYPTNVINRMISKLKYLSNTTVKVCASMETVTGIGEYISYADTLTKNSKSSVVADLIEIQDGLLYGNFNGICIHDYNGFISLEN